MLSSNPNITSPAGIERILLLGLLFEYNGSAWSGGIILYANASYIGVTSASNTLSFSYPVLLPSALYNVSEVETLLVLYDYPWHASGYFLYNTTTGAVNIEEMIYPGVVTAQVTITGG